jgi:hypothetical protein
MLATLKNGVIASADTNASASNTTLTTSVTPTNADNHVIVFVGARRPDAISWNNPPRQMKT